jgi:hypothetical protein
MNPLEGLAQYLDRLERRLRLFAWTRGAAGVLGAALVLTVAIVASLILDAFSPLGLIFGRFVLFLGIGAAIAVGLVVPLMRMNRRRAAQEVEHRHPGFDQRLLTFTERSRDNAADPFLPLLAEDALIIARDAEPEQIIDKARFIRFASLGAAARCSRLRHCAALGQLFKGHTDQTFLQHRRAAGFEDHPPQVGSDNQRQFERLHIGARERLGAIREFNEVGRSADAAAKFRPGLRFPACAGA